MATLFTKIKELTTLGEITWESFYRPDLGPGERALFHGMRTRMISNFVGNTKNIENAKNGDSGVPAMEFKEPHDLLVCEPTGQLITYAKS